MIAFIAHNQLQPAEISGLIRLVANRLPSLGAEAAPPVPAKAEPVVPLRRSVSPDQIVCLTVAKRRSCSSTTWRWHTS